MGKHRGLHRLTPHADMCQQFGLDALTFHGLAFRVATFLDILEQWHRIFFFLENTLKSDMIGKGSTKVGVEAQPWSECHRHVGKGAHDEAADQGAGTGGRDQAGSGLILGTPPEAGLVVCARACSSASELLQHTAPSAVRAGRGVTRCFICGMPGGVVHQLKNRPAWTLPICHTCKGLPC